MSQKRLMLLGGLAYLLPVIEAAHKQGYYVITADYLPDNVAHKYSDEYCDVSVLDKEAVLEAARKLKIDGIMSFAVDPGVVAASYVQNRMGLPSFGPYESVRILQNKDLFRKFLADNGFNVPAARSYTSIEAALDDMQWCEWPMIVKPTDSAGSKGVTRVDCIEDMPQALAHAFRNSFGGSVIVEQFIEKDGCSSDSDGFSLDGEFKIITFSNQYFDEDATGEYVPAAYSWPSTMDSRHQQTLRKELQRLISLLGMKTSIYNIETRVGKDGKPYIMEVSPRGGGNRLAEVIRYASGMDMITACVRAAVGDSVEDLAQAPFNGYWAEIIMHSHTCGRFKGIEIAEDIKPNIFQTDLWVKSGDEVRDFLGANNAIGTLVLNFDNEKDLNWAISNQKEWLKIIVH